MIEEVQPELVGIATESGIHAEIALYCIDHGVNCIIEKPIAMSMEDADEIVRRSEEKHVKVAPAIRTVLTLRCRRREKPWKQDVSESFLMVRFMCAGTGIRTIMIRLPGEANGHLTVARS